MEKANLCLSPISLVLLAKIRICIEIHSLVITFHFFHFFFLITVIGGAIGRSIIGKILYERLN